MTTSDRLSSDGAALLVVDLQERLLASMKHGSRVVRGANLLVDVAETIRVPIFATEQYPQGLGTTISPLRERLPDRRPKTAFQALGAEGLQAAIEDADVRHVTLCGIETHVCIAQTALALLRMGFSVQVPADAVTSRFEIDWEFGLRRMQAAGVVVSTVESVVFEWLQDSTHPQFRQVSALIKGFRALDDH